MHNDMISFEEEVSNIMYGIPDFLIDMSTDYNIMIAGGMVTSIFSNSSINDIDLYVMSKKDLLPVVIDLLSNSTVTSITNRSMMVNHSGILINLVYFKVFDDVEDIFNSFDFTICMGAFDIRNKKFILHNNFLKDLAKKRLIFNKNTDFPIMSVMRIKKYADRGFNISQKDIIAMVLRCMQLKINSYEELKSHIGGMYGMNFDHIIDTTKPFDISVIIDDIIKSKEESYKVRYPIDIDEINNVKGKILNEAIGNIRDYLFKFKDRLFLNNNGRLNVIRDTLSNNIECPILTGIIRLYKFVKKTDNENVFKSYYKEGFTYEIGKEVVSASPYIWGGCFNMINHFTNNNKKDKALIELEVNVEDIVYINNTDIQFKRAKVIREMIGDYNIQESNTYCLFDLLE